MLPFLVDYGPNPVIVRSNQANWFAANCNVFWQLKMPSIYFWELSFVGFYPTRDDSADLDNWMATKTADVIRSCFKRTH